MANPLYINFFVTGLRAALENIVYVNTDPHIVLAGGDLVVKETILSRVGSWSDVVE